MAIRFRKTFKLGKNTKVNMSKSGVSVSKKIGPITINSKGNGSIRLGKGLSYGFRWKKK